MRLTLVIPSLEAGGAERVLCFLAAEWASRGREVSLVTLADAAEDFYPVDPRVRRVGLAPKGVPRPRGILAAPWVRRLRAALRDARPDLVVSFLTRMNLMTVAACAGLPAPVVVGERLTHLWPFDPATRALRRVLYPFAAGLVVQTHEERAWGARFMPTDRVWAIPNPAPAAEGPCDVAGGRTVVTMGRLDAQKGHDLLIEAFARCAARRSEWRMVILGEGPWRGRLAAQVDRCGLAGRVSLPGTVRDVGSELRRAALFVLSSRMEGFPNALLEAMAHGLPAISFDCPSGPRDIVRHEVDGLLVPAGDVAALAGAMDRLMSDEAARLRLAGRASEVAERFTREGFLAQWEEVIEAALRTTPRRPCARDVFLPAERPRSDVEQAEIERRFFADLRLASGVYRTTSAHRLDDLNELVAPHLPADRPLELMDVAVSSGVTTLEWMRSLEARGIAHRMVAGDVHMHAWLVSVGRRFHVLCDPSGHALHFEFLGLSVYRGLRGLWRTPWLVPCALVLRAAWRVILWLRGGIPSTGRQVSLIASRLRAAADEVVEDDILQETPPSLRGRFHAVRAANILQRGYFDDAALARALCNLRSRLRPGGLLIVCRTDTDEANHASVFRVQSDGRLAEVATLGGGSEVGDLVPRGQSSREGS